MQGSTHNVVWFDIPVTDLARAVRFYGAALAREIATFGEPGCELGLLPHSDSCVGGCLVPGGTPSADGPLLYLNCEGRLEAAVAAATAAGGRVLQPIHSIAPHGRRALLLDSEGNRVALHSHS